MQLFPLMMAGLLLVSIAVSSVADVYGRGQQKGERGRRGPRALCDACASTGDVLVGGVFTLLYYTYFTVVRRALDVFACTLNNGGVYTLDADPSVRCWVRGGVHESLVPWAVASLIGFGAGVPSSIAFVLYRFRAPMGADQTLWLAGRGATAGDNPFWSIRRRFSKLYQVRLLVC